LSRIEVIIEHAGAVGLGGVFAEYRKLTEQADRLAAQLAALRSSAEAAWAKLVGDLTAGRSVEPATVTDVATRHRVFEPDGAGAQAYGHAGSALRRQAESSAAAAAAGPLFKAMQDAAATTVGESAKLAKTLPETVRTTDQALDAGAGTTWLRLRALHQMWVQLHALEEQRRQAGLVADYQATRQDPNGAWLWYERPERLPTNLLAIAPELRLATAANAGAKPGVFPADEAMARRSAVRPVGEPAMVSS
jgi:hypothetical protein